MFCVIPAKAGIQSYKDVKQSSAKNIHPECFYNNFNRIIPSGLDPRLRGDDVLITSAPLKFLLLFQNHSMVLFDHVLS
jgi:hypothetical protein